MSIVPNPTDVLRNVHELLEIGFWPRTLSVSQGYSIQADDNDGEKDNGWLSVTIGYTGDVAINLDRKGCGFRYPGGGGGKYPRVRNACIYLAESIRLDSEEGTVQDQEEGHLGKLHNLLDNMPWLPTLELTTYTVQSENAESSPTEGWLSVTFTELNDVWLEIDGFSTRFRLFSEGGHKLRVVAALYILAEAIRLDILDKKARENGCN